MNDNNNKHQQRQVNEVLRAMVEKFSSPSAKFLLQDDTPDENGEFYRWSAILDNINSALYDAGVDVKNPDNPWDEVLEYLTETSKKINSLLILLDEKDRRIRELESDLQIRKFLEECINNHPEENTDNSDSSLN